GQALVPEVGVPGVVVAVGAEPQLHVQLGDGGHPPAERLEQAHLDPLVMADAPRRLLDGEAPRELPAVPRGERRPRPLRVSHASPWCGTWGRPAPATPERRSSSG